jgi:hypothetical protein
VGWWIRGRFFFALAYAFSRLFEIKGRLSRPEKITLRPLESKRGSEIV